MESKTNYFYLPKISLSMSFLAPKFTAALENKDSPAMPLTKKVDPTTQGWPSMDESESLQDLEKQLENLANHHREKQQTNHLVVSTLGLQIFAIALFAMFLPAYIYHHRKMPASTRVTYQVQPPNAARTTQAVTMSTTPYLIHQGYGSCWTTEDQPQLLCHPEASQEMLHSRQSPMSTTKVRARQL